MVARKLIAVYLLLTVQGHGMPPSANVEAPAEMTTIFLGYWTTDQGAEGIRQLESVAAHATH